MRRSKDRTKKKKKKTISLSGIVCVLRGKRTGGAVKPKGLLAGGGVASKELRASRPSRDFKRAKGKPRREKENSQGSHIPAIWEKNWIIFGFREAALQENG